jgi:hypothetical protein
MGSGIDEANPHRDPRPRAGGPGSLHQPLAGDIRHGQHIQRSLRRNGDVVVDQDPASDDLASLGRQLNLRAVGMQGRGCRGDERSGERKQIQTHEYKFLQGAPAALH